MKDPDPESVFKETHYALEKIGNFLRNSGSGAIPGVAGTAASKIIAALDGFEQKLLAKGRCAGQFSR